MRDIYTSIDIGSDNIKIVVAEFIGEKFYVLARTSVNSAGVKRGIIVDYDMVLNSLRLALNEIENNLGIRVSKAIVCIPSNDRELSIIEGTIDIDDEQIDKEDITRLLQEIVKDKIKENYELVSLIPIIFKTDNDNFTKDPKGVISKTLSCKAVLALAPKKRVFDILKLVKDADVECVDIVFGTVGDYFASQNELTIDSLGAIVNIGYEKTNVSLFNKGILIKDSIINLGSKNIDKDIAYIYKVDLKTARELKETFSSSTRRFADINEVMEIKLSSDDKEVINQYEITEVVEARVSEILKLVKKEINDLTKRKISYIIVTGGITELMGFSYVVENVLGINSSCLVLKNMGIRNNKYSSSIGAIKYYRDKMKLRGRESSFFSEYEIYDMNNSNSALELTDDMFSSMVLNYYTGD